MARTRSIQRAIPYAIFAVVGLAVMSVLFWYVRTLLASKVDKSQRQVVQVIKIIRPPEAPPPPPPPPPEKVPEPIVPPTPEDKPVDQSDSQQLGIDAEGSAGGDSFGLTGRPGGRDLVGGGTGAFVWYTTMLKDLVQDVLSSDTRARRGKYTVVVRVWVARDGRIERVALTQPTGNHELDSAIEQALNRGGRVREAPPIEMPQPVTLKIVSRS
jgi:periplasmic protein TonB